MILGTSKGATAAGWHSIAAFLRCPKEYQFSNVRGLRPVASQTPEALAIGLMIHAGRARWFSLNFAPSTRCWDEVYSAMLDEAETCKLPVSNDARMRATDLMKRYIDFWITRPLPTPRAAEYDVGPAALHPGDQFMLWRTARLDDVSVYPEGGNALWIGECKTTSGDVTDVHKEYRLHGQLLLQYALWKAAPQGEATLGPVAGVMLDIIRKPYAKQSAKFARIAVPINPRVLTWYIKNLRHVLRAAAQVGPETDVPRNVTACTRMIGRMRVECEFQALCSDGKAAGLKYVDASGKTPNAGDCE